MRRPVTSRRQFLLTTGAAVGLGGLGLLGWEQHGPHLGADAAAAVPRRYPACTGETAGGWHKYPGNPVLGGSLGTCFDVCVLHDAGRFRMWFSWRPHGSIALVESRDGIHWSPPRIVLPPGPAGSWQETVNRPCVVKIDGRYHLWYTGQDATSSAIGHAMSQDGVRWEARSADPVFAPERAWEKMAVMTPSVLYDAASGTFRLWYSGGDQEQIGLVIHPGADLGFDASGAKKPEAGA